MKSGKVLITGGLGFIGRHIAELLVKQGHPVLLFDNLSPQTHGAVPQFPACELVRHPWVEIFRGDVRRPADWEKVLPGVSYVVHLAAETGTAQSMYEISRYTETNVGGTAALLDYLANRKHGVGKIILGSSRAVYGEGAYRCVQCGPVYPPMRSDERLRCGQWEPLCPSCGNSIEAAATPEGAKLAPASIYAATKLAQEDLVRIAARAMGIPAVILRMQNVYNQQPLTALRQQCKCFIDFNEAYDYFGKGWFSKAIVRFGVWIRYYTKVLGYYLSSDKRVIKGPGAPRKETAAQAALLIEPRARGENNVGYEEVRCSSFSQSGSDTNSVVSQ